MAEDKKSKRIYCNTCKSTTHHLMHGSSPYHHEDELGYYLQGEYRLWACAGCDTGTLENWFTQTDMIDPDTMQSIYESILVPKRAHADLPRKYFRKLPSKLSKIYREVVAAFNEKLYVLCASGLRSLVEGICADKGVR